MTTTKVKQELEFLSGRLDGLAATSRYELPDELRSEIKEVNKKLASYIKFVEVKHEPEVEIPHGPDKLYLPLVIDFIRDPNFYSLRDYYDNCVELVRKLKDVDLTTADKHSPEGWYFESTDPTRIKEWCKENDGELGYDGFEFAHAVAHYVDMHPSKFENICYDCIIQDWCDKYQISAEGYFKLIKQESAKT